MVMFSLDRVDVFTTEPGAEIRIGSYGKATNTEACRVPAEVAAEFAGQPGFRVEGYHSQELTALVEATGSEQPTEPKKKARKGQED